MFGWYMFDITYYIFVIPAFILAMFAQIKVSSTFSKYSNIRNSRGYTGAEIAEKILRENGVNDVRVEAVSGNLTDHFDPTKKVVRLSQDVYNSTSVAALGVAAHECGHAIQHNVGYAPLKIRNAIIPITNIGSNLTIPLIILGVIFTSTPLINIGLVLFSLATVFQLITLPVEFNASKRAIRLLDEGNILDSDELDGSKKVLSAAAMTYVAALFVSLMQLLYLVSRFSKRD